MTSKTKFVIKITDTGFRLLKCEFKKGRWKIIASAKQAFGAGSSAEAVTEKIGEEFKKLKFKNELLVVALPQNVVALRQFKVPSADPQEISGMVDLWALRCMPYPAEEMVTAYSLIKQDDQGYSCVNLNVVHCKETERLFQILNPWLKNIEAFVLSSYGFANLGVNSGAAPVVIVNIEELCADIIIVRGDRLLFGRAVAISTQDSDFREKLAGEIGKTVKAYRRENIDGDPASVIVAHPPSGLGGFLKERIDLPVEELDLSEPALAAVLNLDRRFINLLPREIKEKKERLVLQSQLGKVVAIFLAGFLAVAVSSAVVFYGYRVRLNRIKEEQDKIYPKVKELVAIKHKKEALLCKTAKARAVDVLREIYRIMPSGIYLNSLSYARGKEAMVRGRAQDLSGVLDSLPLFGKSDVFKDAKVNYATKRKAKDTEAVEFEIVAHLK